MATAKPPSQRSRRGKKAKATGFPPPTIKLDNKHATHRIQNLSGRALQIDLGSRCVRLLPGHCAECTALESESSTMKSFTGGTPPLLSVTVI